MEFKTPNDIIFAFHICKTITKWFFGRFEYTNKFHEVSTAQTIKITS